MHSNALSPESALTRAKDRGPELALRGAHCWTCDAAQRVQLIYDSSGGSQLMQLLVIASCDLALATASCGIESCCVLWVAAACP